MLYYYRTNHCKRQEIPDEKFALFIIHRYYENRTETQNLYFMKISEISTVFCYTCLLYPKINKKTTAICEKVCLFLNDFYYFPRYPCCSSPPDIHHPFNSRQTLHADQEPFLNIMIKIFLQLFQIFRTGFSHFSSILITRKAKKSAVV